jgi:hypothetical protein
MFVPILKTGSFIIYERNMMDIHDLEKFFGTLSCSLDLCCLLMSSDAAGLLFNGKDMDAELAAAIWYEANISYQQQYTIIRHVSRYFGLRLNVTLRRNCEL